MTTVPEIDLSDPELLEDPAAVYGRARERAPVARLVAPGFGPMWAVTRHAEARAMLADPRFGNSAASYPRLDVPEHCRPYLRTMQEMAGPDHQRLRRLSAPAFTARRADAFRPVVARIVERLLDDVADLLADGPADLLEHFAGPLPMYVVCALLGVPDEARPAWLAHGRAVAAGNGPAFTAAVPAIIDGAREIAPHVADLFGDGLTEQERITQVWHLVLAGQTPTNLIANAVAALLEEPSRAALLRAEPGLLPGAVEELTRWCGPQLLTVPRYVHRPADLAGVTVNPGEPVTVAIVAANRDPRVFPDPERLDLRSTTAGAHLGYAHGPHFCLGAPLARVQTEVALGALLARFPDLALSSAGALAGVAARRVPDPGTWRLAALPVTAGDDARPT
ncbi:cytochrome P450 [Dactylosporangium aurantiacum]|uniref:cytochrome P450 n=1 Tax=Dactylosporangium aurantiacum TaxID=35754 RepID=UPI000525525B|nr:cytochrome P450 [Dactylosporangium aurantiacum]MDG6108491.1 cytochrome P450 [Dactylosporangium aurantiacum]